MVSRVRTARPSRSEATVRNGASSAASMASSVASSSFSPCAEKNLMPLSWCGLCEAEMTMPPSARIEWVRCATAGVGIGPISCTSTPAATSPASSAASNM